MAKSPKSVFASPPSRGSISLRPMNQESILGPTVIASHTCSGVASTVISRLISNACAICLELLRVRGDAGMDGHHHAVIAPALGPLVVVPGDKVGNHI